MMSQPIFTTLLIDDEFRQIRQEIVDQNWTDSQWAEHEADDWFQSSRYCGGFDSTENEFCFSYLGDNSVELWFQISLREVPNVLTGVVRTIQCRQQS